MALAQYTILHSDLNSFYASVEMMLNPTLRHKAVAVCGSTEERHGIVLAKSELAKRAGVKTGMVTWAAKRLCPELITVPPQIEQYVKYSELTRTIYERYSDLVEPFGMDECWIDVTASRRTCGDGYQIAEDIRKTVCEELGLTVSIGVSFSKVFAKLGSDIKKPDAVTCITAENYKDMVWPLPASDLLGVGRATGPKLQERGIYTIGDVAKCDPDLMRSYLGINGVRLWAYANGEDHASISPYGYEPPVKSIGHGITANADLVNEKEVQQILYELAQAVAKQLRQTHLIATRIQLFVRDTNLSYREFQGKLEYPTQSWREMVDTAMALFRKRYTWQNPVRSITIRAINLIHIDTPIQLDLFGDHAKRKRMDALEVTIEGLQERFGRDAVVLGSSMHGLKMQKDRSHELLTMPSVMYT